MRSDIIDKVLLRDLPSLHGITDVQELYRLFTMLALNTGNEISLETIAQNSTISKGTLKRYLEYLESAFLLKAVYRIDQNARRFLRDRTQKVYLTNPSLRSGLFSPISETSRELGHLVETAIFAQRFHRLESQLHYARYGRGDRTEEIDLVQLEGGIRPIEAVEIKYSDRIAKQRKDWAPLVRFCHKNSLREITVTTRGVENVVEMESVVIRFEPSALHAYRVGFDR